MQLLLVLELLEASTLRVYPPQKATHSSLKGRSLFFTPQILLNIKAKLEKRLHFPQIRCCGNYAVSTRHTQSPGGLSHMIPGDQLKAPQAGQVVLMANDNGARRLGRGGGEKRGH